MTSETDGQWKGMKLSNPNDVLTVPGPPPHGEAVLDFWRWAYGFLSDDPIKGEYAEWMVAKLLDIPTKPGSRIEGNDWDLIEQGVKIEVKATAYWQAWKFRNQDGTWKSPDTSKPAPIRFANLWTRKTLGPISKADFKADVYVLCLQCEKDPRRWDALDLSQWTFFILTAHPLRSMKAERDRSWKNAEKSKSFGLSLKALRKSKAPELSAVDFKERALRLIETIAAQQRGR